MNLSRMLPLDPESGPKITWDCFCLCLLMYCSFSVPYALAFESDQIGDALARSNVVNVILDCTFMFDIVLSFLTAYDSQGVMVRDFRAIASNYARSWFVFDVCGSFPVDEVVSLFVDQTSKGSTNLIRAMKLIRMLKLIRAIKFMNKLNNLKEKEGFELFGTFIGIASAVFMLIFTAHVLGCSYIVLLAFQADDSNNWLRHYRPDLEYSDDWTRYIIAMYFSIITITTMGYGDILPVTQAERIFAILVALIGAVVFSYCMGTISSLISQVTGADDRYKERVRFVTEYLQFREVPRRPPGRRNQPSITSLNLAVRLA